MSLSFVILCGKCFRVVPANSSGSVLSCGDILCSTCNAIPFNESSTCPACGKDGVKAVNLNDRNLPEEVAKNLGDPSKELESIHEVLVFQVKYYKQVMKRLLVRANKSEHENENYRRIIMDLENKLLSNTNTDYRPNGGNSSTSSDKNDSNSMVVWSSGTSSKNQSAVHMEGNSFNTMRRPPSAQLEQHLSSPSQGILKGQVSVDSSPQVSRNQPPDARRPQRVSFQNQQGQQEQNHGSIMTPNSVLGKRSESAQSSPHHDHTPSFQTHNSPRLSGMNTPQMHMRQQQQSPQGQFNGSAASSSKTGFTSCRMISSPFVGNRPPSTQNRSVQSPGGGQSRLRSPHMPIVRSPALPMSPNKGVHVSQSEHQMAQQAQLQQYSQNSQSQQQAGESASYLQQFIGEE